MANPRVHEIAAELGVDSKVALGVLREMGELPRSASSSIPPPVARKLRASLIERAPVPAPNRASLAEPLGRAALDALHAGHSQLPRLATLLARGLAGHEHGAAIATAIGSRNFFVAYLESGLPHRDSLERDHLIAPSGVAILKATSGGSALLAWASSGDQLQLLFAVLNAAGGALVLDDFHSSRAALIDGRYLPVAGSRASALSLLAHVEASVPRRETSLRGHAARVSHSDSQKSKRMTPEVGVVYLARGGAQRKDHQGDSAARATRWQVRGHYRDQWYSATQEHKRIWIEEHAAGPKEGNPIVRDLVRVIVATALSRDHPPDAVVGA